MFLNSGGGLGQVALAPPTGAHVLHQEMSWNLVPLWFNSPGYATAVNSHFHMFERGPVPLVLPPLAPMSPTRKYVRHVCPSSLKILGTPLKSAHGLNSRRGLGQVPLSPAQGRPCPPPGNALASCASLVQNSWLRTLQSTAILIFLGRGEVPLVQPPLAPMSPTSKCLDH